MPALGWGYGDDRMRDEDDEDAAEEEEWILKARSRQYPDSWARRAALFTLELLAGRFGFSVERQQTPLGASSRFAAPGEVWLGRCMVGAYGMRFPDQQAPESEESGSNQQSSPQKANQP